MLQRQRKENHAFRKGQPVLHETVSAKKRKRKKEGRTREEKMKKIMDSEKASK